MLTGCSIVIQWHADVADGMRKWCLEPREALTMQQLHKLQASLFDVSQTVAVSAVPHMLLQLEKQHVTFESCLAPTCGDDSQSGAGHEVCCLA